MISGGDKKTIIPTKLSLLSHSFRILQYTPYTSVCINLFVFKHIQAAFLHYQKTPMKAITVAFAILNMGTSTPHQTATSHFVDTLMRETHRRWGDET